MEKPLKVGEAAQLLGFSRSTLRRAIAMGQLPSKQTPGGHALLDRADVEAYAQRLQTPGGHALLDRADVEAYAQRLTRTVGADA